MVEKIKNNRIFPSFSKNLVRLFAQFDRKAKLSKTNSHKVIKTKQSDWMYILK